MGKKHPKRANNLQSSFRSWKVDRTHYASSAVPAQEQDLQGGATSDQRIVNEMGTLHM